MGRRRPQFCCTMPVGKRECAPKVSSHAAFARTWATLSGVVRASEPTLQVGIIADVMASAEMLALCRVLDEHGFQFRAVSHDGAEGFARNSAPCAVLVTTQPSVDVAITSVRAFRALHGLIPIIVLGGDERFSEVKDLIAAGADRYQVPPHDTTEFARALKELLHERSVAPHLLRFPGITLDEIGMTVYIHGRAFALTFRECALLACLMRDPGRAVSAETLIQEAWPGGDPRSLQSLRSQISALRKMIEPNSRRPKCIVSVRGRGYMFEPEP